jgi:ATP-dependent exoDNAse (exonuclease V) beta subunit
VYDIEYQISGSIDMVYWNPEDNTLSIFDWKRTTDLEKREGFRNKMSIRFPSSIPDTKFHKYSLQLNIYKAIVERNYGYKVKELFLVGLHPQNVSGTFQLMKCVDLSAEVEELFQERLQKIKNI